MFVALIGGVALLCFTIGVADAREGEPGSGDGRFQRAIFAGGCFWCMQPAFDRLAGVISTAVGYTGGTIDNPTYEQVCAGRTGHVEAIEIVFDPALISFRELIEIFWQNVDPMQANGQFADKGPQYRTVIFFQNEDQRLQAEASKQELEKSGRFAGRIATEIEPAKPFYKAEEYHQEYYLKDPARYTLYKIGSGRASFLEKIWGKKD
jgi:peptide-methionine (S)-S-oxide reductase